MKQTQTLDIEAKNLLLPYVKSFYSYRNIQKLEDLSKSDLKAFTELFQDELKKFGINKLRRVIIMQSRFLGYEAQI